MTEQQLGARLGQQRGDVFALAVDAVPMARRAADSTAAAIRHVDGERIGKCTRKPHVVLSSEISAADENQSGSDAQPPVADWSAVR